MKNTLFIVLGVSMAFAVVHGQMDCCNTGCGCNQNQNCGCGCSQNQNCGCGGGQNQNCYGGMRNTFGQPVSPACQGPLPCYDIVLSFIGDGPQRLEVINNEEEFLRVPSRAGRMRSQVIADGRQGAVFFRDTYGVDFTSMPDTVFLSGRRMNEEGVELRPFSLNPVARYRMYMASTRSETQLFNRPIYNQGWMLNFTRPMWGRGTFRKLIPAGTFAVFGHYTIHPCGMPPMDDFPRPCRNILNLQDPWAPLVIAFKSPSFIQVAQEPYTHLPIDLIVEHPVWGEGRGMVMATFRMRDSEETIADQRNTLTFPNYK